MRGLLVLVLLVAGCVGEPEVMTRPPPEETTRVPLALAPCDILEAIVVVPEARASPHVPPGFRLSAANGQANVVLGAATCDQGGRAFLAIPVVPEDERLQAPDIRHYFEPEHLVDASAFANALADARGLADPARVATWVGPPEVRFEVEAGNGTHVAAGNGAALAPFPPGVAGGVFREWFPAEGGYGYLEASFARADAGLGATPARVTTAPGSIAREVLGEEAVAQLLVLRGSGYADASLGHVRYP